MCVPSASEFILCPQVDDLKSIDALEDYLAETAVGMIFVSKGYFKSGSAPLPR